MKKFAIIVTYEPLITRLLQLIFMVLKQDFYVVVVDNSEKNPLQDILKNDKFFLISLKENKGIAYAQNIGVDFCESKGANVISFLDQDSIIFENTLFLLAETIINDCISVACPISIDEITGYEYPSHKINKYGITRNVFSKESNTLAEVDIAISSGMTMSIQTFKLIGDYDEDFFIDFVDIEWCLRARKNLVKIYIVPDSVILHRIGEKSFHIGFLNINQHSPMRTYYKIRNSFILLNKKYNIIFCLRQIMSAIIHNLILIVVSKEMKKEYFKFYIKGLYDGILGKIGKLNL